VASAEVATPIEEPDEVKHSFVVMPRRKQRIPVRLANGMEDAVIDEVTEQTSSDGDGNCEEIDVESKQVFDS
jgi:hypothetical protein